MECKSQKQINNIMEQIECPKEAIIQSFIKPVSYENYILYRGAIMVIFRS